jgi:iron complex transport system substrate-binding protein
VALTDSVTEKPTVFANTPFEGTWYMPGGQSFTAQLLADAGADYLWADDESTGTLFLDFETVFDQAATADYWINIGFFGGLADLTAADERFSDFAAYQNNGVYNNDARTNDFGGNDFYEGGVANPHLVLADLIKIFHPELLPDHEFVYYRLVE